MNSSRPTKRGLSSNHPNTSSSGSSNITLSVQPTVPTLTPAQMYSNFEEWIKMCTDNKVNVSNTWNFALIDYFHDMTFIREGDSINFQKASCTLDGCVKIYTSRVDSVANETGKLLSGLADSTHADNDDEERHKEKRVRRKMTRIDTTLLKDFSTLAVKKFDLDFTVDPLFKKTSADFDEGGARGLLLNHLSLDQNCKIIFDASDATVEGELEDAGNEQAIMSIEHIDPEEPVDSENEDDASSSDEARSDLEIEETQVKPDPADQEQPDLDKDVEMKESEVDANKDDETKEDQADNKKEDEAKEDQADNNKEDEIKEDQADNDKEGKVNEDEQEKKDPSSIADQQSKEGSPSAQEKPAIVVQGEDNIKENSPIATHINEESRVEIYRLKAKLPNFDDLPNFHIVPFLKGFDFFTDDATLAIPDLDNDDDEDEAMMDIAREMNVASDAFHFDDDYGVDYGDDMDDMDPFAETNDDHQFQGGNESAQPDESAPASPKYPENDFLSAFMHKGDQDMLNYFDSTLTKNWAGPEHWKLRRPVEKRVTTTTTAINAEHSDRSRRASARKQAAEFFLPFRDILKEDDDAPLEKVFDQAARRPALSKDVLNKMPDNVLPEDIHFSSKLLLQYSLKPAFPGPRKKKLKQHAPATSNDQPQDTGDTPDVDFWAGQTQPYDDDMMDYGVDYGDDMDMPTDTYDANDQTILTAYEDNTFYNDNYDENEHSTLYGDELITNHHLKKSKPLYVNYARTAKRVDVKKLKDNLWKVLTNNDLGEEKVQGELKFTDIVNNLKKLYSPKTMRDISVPFCFICLLHLANEKDLSITGMGPQQQDDDDFVLGDDNDWMSNETILSEVTVVQN
ncbi:condensin complex subunit 2 [Mucor circinelloides 1006PhL]|uniref:Condensin complex subunit 2 n=1 Tax=Mucor circinelloides f. circinelloides (strain 1006PhL) TaxID=1220926 RepID=S2IUQ7_MUCC1|nr:condensin complex subunit 2 [Mucor circinelloides 1006PhL]